MLAFAMLKIEPFCFHSKVSNFIASGDVFVNKANTRKAALLVCGIKILVAPVIQCI